MVQYELPKLPYRYDELEPYIDAETMKIHHQKTSSILCRWSKQISSRNMWWITSSIHHIHTV